MKEKFTGLSRDRRRTFDVTAIYRNTGPVAQFSRSGDRCVDKFHWNSADDWRRWSNKWMANCCICARESKRFGLWIKSSSTWASRSIRIDCGHPSRSNQNHPKGKFIISPNENNSFEISIIAPIPNDFSLKWLNFFLEKKNIRKKKVV